jgi:hypothetical protein
MVAELDKKDKKGVKDNLKVYSLGDFVGGGWSL